MALWILNPAEPNAEPTHQGFTPADYAPGSGVGAGIGAVHSLPPYLELIEPTYVSAVRNPPGFDPPFVVSYTPPARHFLRRYLYEPGQPRTRGAMGNFPGFPSFCVDGLPETAVIYWSEGFLHQFLFPFAQGFERVCNWFVAFDLDEVPHTAGEGSVGLPNPAWTAFITHSYGDVGRASNFEDYYVWFSGRFLGYRNGFNTLGTNSFDDPFRTEEITTIFGPTPSTSVLPVVPGHDNDGDPNGEEWYFIHSFPFVSDYILKDDQRLTVKPFWP